MDTRILIKYNNSRCNENLLAFLHSNIARLKKHANVKVIIVYEDMYEKINGAIKRLPLMLLGTDQFTGYTSIRRRLTSLITPESGGSNGIHSNNLQDYWNAEIHSKLSDDDDCSEDVMEQVKRTAMEQTASHKSSFKRKKKSNNANQSDVVIDNIKLSNVKQDRICDMVGDDKLMKNFWENQEETPGCNDDVF